MVDRVLLSPEEWDQLLVQAAPPAVLTVEALGCPPVLRYLEVEVGVRAVPERELIGK